VPTGLTGWDTGTGTGEPLFTGAAPVDMITLTCATSGAAIRYTVDGAYPTPDSTLYSAPFDAPEVGTLVRCAAYKTDMLPSGVHQFILRDDA
jgi:hypothetical protein